MKPMQKARLPVRQLAILAVCRFAEPVALTAVSPYLPEMVESFGVPTNKVAYWVGVASASFSFAQCFTAIFWGRMSDRFGRKYMILTSLCFTMITSLNFGLSKSLAAMITARSLGGAAAGTVGIIRTMVAELVPQKELQPRAYSIMPLVWTSGSILGPSFGGSLVNPVDRYPKLFCNSWLLTKYPFLLPNLATSVLFLVGIIVGVLFLQETLESRKHRKDYGLIAGQVISRSCRRRTPKRHSWPLDHETEPLVNHDSSAGGEQSNVKSKASKRPRYGEVFSRQSNINLIVYTLLAMHSQAYDQLVPIFMHHPVQDVHHPSVVLPFKFAGGFGLSSTRIGLLFTIYGVGGMIFQFLVFPPFAKKFGVLNCLRVVATAYPLIYFLTPFTSLMSTSSARQGIMITLMVAKCFMGIFAFPCSTILLTNSAASLAILGTLNGIATSLSAMGRAAGPFLGGSIFSIWVNKGYIIVPWWCLSFVAILAAIPVYFLVEMEGFGTDGDANAIDDENFIDGADGSSPQQRDLSKDFRSNSSLPIAYRNKSNEAAIDEELGPTLRKVNTAGHQSYGTEGRISNAIGVGDVGSPNARRFSNSLGVTRSGFGAEPRQGT